MQIDTKKINYIYDENDNLILEIYENSMKQCCDGNIEIYNTEINKFSYQNKLLYSVVRTALKKGKFEDVTEYQLEYKNNILSTIKQITQCKHCHKLLTQILQ
jgi:hypothetical protein